MKRKITLFIAAAALAAASWSRPSARPARRRLRGPRRELLSHSERRRSAAFSSTHAAVRSMCSRRTSTEGAPVTGPVRRTGRRCSPPRSPGRKGRARRAARRDQVDRRQAAGDVRGTPALQVLRRQEGGPDKRRRPHRLRRRLGCGRGERPRGRTQRLVPAELAALRRRLRRLRLKATEPQSGEGHPPPLPDNSSRGVVTRMTSWLCARRPRATHRRRR